MAEKGLKPTLRKRALLRMERVRDAGVTCKVLGAADSVAASCGFVVWKLGRAFRPLTKSVSEHCSSSWREYREAHPKE